MVYIYTELFRFLAVAFCIISFHLPLVLANEAVSKRKKFLTHSPQIFFALVQRYAFLC